MKLLLTLLALTAVFTLPVSAAPKKPAKPAPEKPAPAAEKEAPDFTGRYERTGDPKSVFILHVRQTGANADLEYSASKADGTGAAPDGSGSGSLNEQGELIFTFTDSFGNKGTGVLKIAGKIPQLTMKAETVNDPRAVKFYGVIALKRTVDRE